MDSLDSCTLLYVEDEQALRAEMAAFLKLHLQRVIAAANGCQALELLDEEEVDLVLTDIRMPEMDGLALATRLRERYPELPVVLYTAFSDVPTLIRGIELGVAGFAQKPTDAGKLVETLEKAALPVLQRRRIAALGKELQDAVNRLGRTGTGDRTRRESVADSRPATTGVSGRPQPADLPLTMATVEKWAILRALDAAKGKKTVAARLLGMNYYTFRRHLVRHHLEPAGDD